MAMGQNLWYHIWVDEHPFTSYFDVHQGYRVLTQNIPKPYTYSDHGLATYSWDSIGPVSLIGVIFFSVLRNSDFRRGTETRLAQMHAEPCPDAI